jgi:hypothetical protein
VQLGVNNASLVDDVANLSVTDNSGVSGGTVSLAASGLTATSDSGGVTYDLGSGVTNGTLSFGAAVNDYLSTSGFTLNDAASVTTGVNAILDGANLSVTDDVAHGIGFADGTGGSGGNITLASGAGEAIAYSSNLNFGLANGATSGSLLLGQGVSAGVDTSGFNVSSYPSATNGAVVLQGNNLSLTDNAAGGLTVSDGSNRYGDRSNIHSFSSIRVE